jgi:predicted metal-binding protein
MTVNRPRRTISTGTTSAGAFADSVSLVTMKIDVRCDPFRYDNGLALAVRRTSLHECLEQIPARREFQPEPAYGRSDLGNRVEIVVLGKDGDCAGRRVRGRVWAQTETDGCEDAARHSSCRVGRPARSHADRHQQGETEDRSAHDGMMPVAQVSGASIRKRHDRRRCRGRVRRRSLHLGRRDRNGQAGDAILVAWSVDQWPCLWRQAWSLDVQPRPVVRLRGRRRPRQRQRVGRRISPQRPLSTARRVL